MFLLLHMPGAALAGWACVRLWPFHATRLLIFLGRFAAGLHRREAAIPGFRLAYLDGGQGEPLLLLHGIGADKYSFLMVAAILRRHYRVIIPDLPGFGESDKPAQGNYEVARQIERLQAFLGALGIEQLHIGGHSMGGLIAGAYAAAHPSQVQSVWLLGPAGVQSAQPSELMQAIDSGLPLPIFARNLEETRRLVSFVSHRPLHLPRFMLEYACMEQANNFALNQKIAGQLLAGPGLEHLMAARLDVPALIVWGNQDRAADVSGAAVMAGLLPNARIVTLPGIGHIPMIEAPRRVAGDYLAYRAALRIIAD